MQVSKVNKVKNSYIVSEPDNRIYLSFKRLLDIVGAIIGLIVLAPLFIIVAALIKIEDPQGKVFFRQVRVGRNGNEFYMYKFRSMVANAEQILPSLLAQNEAQGAIFKMKHDPRVTKVGRFIRRTSIDELPQLLNVLKGEMSLTGPRPPLPREVEQYSPYAMQRLSVVPGCTGLWQVSGRSGLGFDEMVALDLEYIMNRNLWLDIKIILKTFVIIFKSEGAY